MDLLNIVPPLSKLKGSQLNMVWLGEQFRGLFANADDIAIQCYARVYILQLIEEYLFIGKSNNLMHIMFLPFLRILTPQDTIIKVV